MLFLNLCDMLPVMGISRFLCDTLCRFDKDFSCSNSANYGIYPKKLFTFRTLLTPSAVSVAKEADGSETEKSWIVRKGGRAEI